MKKQPLATKTAVSSLVLWQRYVMRMMGRAALRGRLARADQLRIAA